MAPSQKLHPERTAAMKKLFASPTTLHDIPDKLLQLILLNLTSPLWLVHAAATCRQWCRIIASTNFLVHIHIHCHPRPFAGHYECRASKPRRGCYSRTVFVPSSPAVGVGSRHFSLGFIPGGSAWHGYSRGSLLLFAKKKSGWRRHCFPDLLVCEPVTQRYQVIPLMTEKKYHHCLGVSLHEDEGILSIWGRVRTSMARFRVTCVLYERYAEVCDDAGTVSACVFRLNGRACWSVVKDSKVLQSTIHLHGADSVQLVGRTALSVFWEIKDGDSLLVLNLSSTKFSLLILQPGHSSGEWSALRIVDDDYHKVRVVSSGSSDLRIFMKWWNGNGEWVLQRTIHLTEVMSRLPKYDEYCREPAKIVSASPCSVILMPVRATWLFSVDLETMEAAECVQRKDGSYADVQAYPYELPWPPSLNAYVVRCTRSLKLCQKSHRCSVCRPAAFA